MNNKASPVVTVLKSLEEAEDNTREVDPHGTDDEDDDANDDGKLVAMGVDEGQNTTSKGHYHIEEGEEDPWQQQEPSLLQEGKQHTKIVMDVYCIIIYMDSEYI